MNHLQLLIGRSPEVCYTQINHDEIVVLNPIDGNFYHLNESAVDLWLFLDIPKTPAALAQMLADKYMGQIKGYQQDVKEWVEDTRQKGLLTIHQINL